jgi:predicted N-formylglutamate amidohydrolase
MSDSASSPTFPHSPLLGADDPPPCEIANPDGKAPLLLVCDHASRTVPRVLGHLGLDESAFEGHIAFDIGAAAVTRQLAHRLDAPAILAGYSRLLIDCNRQPGDPQSIPEESDGTIIPGNRGLSERMQEVRVESFFRPYHNAITTSLGQLWRRGTPPALFSIHSFTPRMDGLDRIWDVGVLWNRDPRIAIPLIDRLRKEGNLCVGDNEPYSGRQLFYTLDRHASAAGLPNCAVEIRQDLLETDDGVMRWASRLAEALEEITSTDELHRVIHF